MTARLSIFDQSEDPWTQTSQQTNGGVDLYSTVTQTSLDKGKMPSTEVGADNSYTLNRTEQEWDTNNHWQELSLRPDSVNVSNASSSQQVPRASSPQLIDLEDTPTNTEANPWSSEKRPDPPPKDNVEDQQPASQPQPPTSNSLPPMSEIELKNFQEKQTETYAIRHINWTDFTGQLRESPVLVQSRNGPCPLLALVNGLIMRSDRKAQPPIVRALQTRENISLGLLIQALFDELVTYSSEQLPDIEALSRFLTMLHTGMNVNPRLTLDSPAAPGSFLETKDIQLYDSFKVPLVHGWIATPASAVHDAMVRVAQYYEDIQLLQFRKEELEDRVFRNGGTLTPDEERLMNDIQTIDQFVNIETTTQLTEFGLDHLGKILPPGSVSILFRNDHFSTLYKHPQSEQLFTLVTDAGYADHAEVVWESLVDITGANTEYYAGDFRPVGHGPSAPGPPGPSHLVSQRTSSRRNAATTSAPSQHNTEQEDADYAYALSLQFQEEAQQQQQQRQRQPSLGRTNENDNQHNVPQDILGATNNDDDIADDAPPPSYEQVSRNKAAEMLNRQPQQRTQPGLGLNTEYGTRRIQQYTGGTPATPTGRRQPLQTVPDRRGQASRDKDCIVM